VTAALDVPALPMESLVDARKKKPSTNALVGTDVLVQPKERSVNVVKLLTCDAGLRTYICHILLNRIQVFSNWRIHEVLMN
jgi:hypothetical protein